MTTDMICICLYILYNTDTTHFYYAKRKQMCAPLMYSQHRCIHTSNETEKTEKKMANDSSGQTLSFLKQFFLSINKIESNRIHIECAM